ncbi:peptidoglycan-binding domain-containing protein [Colwellia psychrerythraea]|uniref:peptidoglycan-binding domain-containing protein n=1 Tax=Colwellia psychrerythraea TaxID=28229 RepID=UPI0012377B5F|nr:peptidoglycan-binding domain-containing protein [Colwellia psychrerythraea]
MTILTTSLFVQLQHLVIAQTSHFNHSFRENALSLTTFRSKRCLLKGIVALSISTIYASASFGGDLLHRPSDRTQWPENLIRAVQKKLNTMGFDAGTADGIIGPNTRRAIRNFQQDTGMEVDGQISSTLLKKLGFKQ